MQYDDMIKSRMSKRAREWLNKAEANKHTFIVEPALDDVLGETLFGWGIRKLKDKAVLATLIQWERLLKPVEDGLRQHLLRVCAEIRRRTRPRPDQHTQEVMRDMPKGWRD